MEITNYLLQCTSTIVSAHLAQNSVTKIKDLTNIISSIFLTLRRLSSLELQGANTTEPAVSIGESIHPDYIICLEDGKKLKMLKRHLKTFYNLSIEDYKKKWGLAENYPVVAPNYAKKRSKLARNMGLGKKPLDSDHPSDTDTVNTAEDTNATDTADNAKHYYENTNAPNIAANTTGNNSTNNHMGADKVNDNSTNYRTNSNDANNNSANNFMSTDTKITDTVSNAKRYHKNTNTPSITTNTTDNNFANNHIGADKVNNNSANSINTNNANNIANDTNIINNNTTK